MRLNREFIDRIENPDNESLLSLRDEAIETTKTRLAKWGFSDISESTVRKLSYTYYYNPQSDSPDYVFLLQDPGGLQRRHTEEIDRLERIGENPALADLVAVYRQFPKSWLLRNRNSDFSSKFIKSLSELDVISMDSNWREYLRNEDFYDDFYMTDVVKYRVDGFSKTDERASVNEFLREELEMIDPKLIFAFGGDAWSALRNYFDATPVGNPSVDLGKITEMHGHLCQASDGLDAHVLPLCHMSGQVWWRFPPEDYIERMEDGLRKWQVRE